LPSEQKNDSKQKSGWQEMIASKKKRGRPAGTGRGKGAQINIRWQPEEVAVIEGFARAHDPQLTRAQALRKIVRRAGLGSGGST
jgi:hypothetical protein